MIGRTLSHYKILEEISRGGMGIVYRALDLNLDREVALKLLPPELVADPERKRRFVQEAKAAAALEHPNIAVVHEVDETEGETFVVMELIQGEMLRDTLERKRLPLSRSLELAAEVAEGLSFAHEKGIVHRDIKPSNIMVTEQGHAKVIDFGLAKLLEPIGREGSEVSTALREQTDSGKVMGTVSYMSPEQARGEKVDHRSDIFSFGIVLYEMLTGSVPFHGKTGIETLNAILNTSTPKLGDLGSGVPAEESYSLQHIVNKCLEKEPTERYQTIQDAVIDLKSSRRHLESGSVSPVASGRRPKLGHFAAVAGVIALLVIGWFALRPETPVQEEAPVAASSKPSIAVLYFENASGNPDLDWLRTGLTDMLVTDLSQSPNLKVLSTDRLYQILRDMNRLDERVTSLDVVQDVAEQAYAETVILGSFMKAGENIRINIRIQDARSGDILTTEKVEGLGDAAVFSMVDDLTRRIKANFMLPTEADPDAQNVTTASLEAYRYFMEGRQLHMAGKYLEAIPLLEKALEIDPQFAIARNSLGASLRNSGQRSEAEEQRRIAVEHAERLPLNERYLVEGSYYAMKEGTFDRAFETLESMLEIYPDHCGARNNLALAYLHFEHLDKAIEHYEEAGRRRCPFVGIYGNLSKCYALSGQFEKSLEVLQEYLEQHADSSVAYRVLGSRLASKGRFDDAMASFQTAEAIRPGDPRHQNVPFLVHVLREEWPAAMAAANRRRASSDSSSIWVGSLFSASVRLFHGRSREAIAEIKTAIDAYEEPETRTALAQVRLAEALLEMNKASEALEHAKAAKIVGGRDVAEWEALFVSALALAKLGRWDEAERTAKELGQVAERLPTEKEKRRFHHLLGELALNRGDANTAVEELERAQSFLLPRGLMQNYRRFTHVPIWFSLAKAYLESDEEEKATQWFRRVAESTNEHVDWPIPYVRSFYFLGKIHESRGEMEKAREYYRRFVDYWGDGDIDREKVEEAKSKIKG